MENITITQNDGKYTIHFQGRLDTNIATQIQEEITTKLAAPPQIKELTWDGEGMEYISSSGLRIMLMLKKQHPTFKIINLAPEIYNVFEMTGFTKMMTVEKALRQISIEGCEEIGRGGVGIVYRVSDDTIIKVFREGTGIDEITNEITMAKEAFVLGMPTAISFDMVRVGKQYGLVYELLKAQTLSQCIKTQPEKIEEHARQYAKLFKQLHSIQVPSDTNIPNAHTNDEKSIKHIQRYFDEKDVEKLLLMHHAIPQGNRLLHCDLQAKNAMMQNQELMLIDMGEVGYGHPLIDLAHAYSAMVGLVGDYEAMIGIKKEAGKLVWDKMIQYYFEGEDAETIQHRCEQIKIASYIRNFSWLSLSDSFPEQVINECKDTFKKRIDQQWDKITEVIKTFDDWTL